MTKWLLTTRSGFWCLAVQVVSTVAAQCALQVTEGLNPVLLAVPIVLAPPAAWALWTNWQLRNRFCRHCGRLANGCWPVCPNSRPGTVPGESRTVYDPQLNSSDDDEGGAQ